VLDRLVEAATASAQLATWITLALSLVLFGIALVNLRRSGFRVSGLRDRRTLGVCAALVGLAILSALQAPPAFRGQELVQLAFFAGMAAAVLTWPSERAAVGDAKEAGQPDE
jgi:hypothetical protein